MSERLFKPKELAPKLAAHYQSLAEIDPDHVIIVPNVGALTRAQALNHLREADVEGQVISIHFAGNTEKYLESKSIMGPYSEEAIIEASGKRWEEERMAEVRTQEYDRRIREEYQRTSLLPNTPAFP